MKKTIEQCAVVHYSVKQMFALVNDIESYPAFLPGCSDAWIQRCGTHWMEACLELRQGWVKQHFITRNIFKSEQRIDMELVKGPFSYLKGYWEFQTLVEAQCCVCLYLCFEICNPVLRFTIEPLFYRMATQMVSVFCQRADALYGIRL